MNKKLVDETTDVVFEKLPLSKNSKTKLVTLADYLVYKDWFTDRSQSGVVIVGFGEKEIFPGYVSYITECRIGQKLKYRPAKKGQITFDNTSTITPFAQDEMIATFMEGIDPELKKFITEYLNELFTRYPEVVYESIEEKLKNKDKKSIEKNLMKSTEEIKKEMEGIIERYLQINHINPIIQAVAGLPKQELVAMAETLVHLTSFKQRVSMNKETVGGPISVALITKAEGFEWIKNQKT